MSKLPSLRFLSSFFRSQRPATASLYRMTKEFKDAASADSHSLCMIPGPVEFHESVLRAMATPAISHTAPTFIEAFGSSIEMLRSVFGTQEAQPFVISGSGTLGWDITAANFIEPGKDRALVVNTGYFGDNFGQCLEAFGAAVTHVRADRIGDAPSVEKVLAELRSHEPNYYKLITITHVDTSTGVLVTLPDLTRQIRAYSPNTLIVVDGVCSVGAEELLFDEWSVDVVVTASQKALGVPSGLLVMMVSPRALHVHEVRVKAVKEKRAPAITSYFGNLSHWLPIMNAYEQRRPSYFATPAVQLIFALHASLQQLLGVSSVKNSTKEALASAVARRIEQHVIASDLVKTSLKQWGLTLVPCKSEVAAHSLTAVYYPDAVVNQGKAAEFLKCISQSHVVVAGGLHKDIATKYFRIGHMNISATLPKLEHIEQTLKAVKAAIDRYS